MLAGENLGRRHHRRLPPGLDHFGHREERDHGLARADVALQEPQHALLGPEIGADFGDRLALRWVSAKGSAASRRRPKAPSATCARPGV